MHGTCTVTGVLSGTGVRGGGPLYEVTRKFRYCSSDARTGILISVSSSVPAKVIKVPLMSVRAGNSSVLTEDASLRSTVRRPHFTMGKLIVVRVVGDPSHEYDMSSRFFTSVSFGGQFPGTKFELIPPPKPDSPTYTSPPTCSSSGYQILDESASEKLPVTFVRTGYVLPSPYSSRRLPMMVASAGNAVAPAAPIPSPLR